MKLTVDGIHINPCMDDSCDGCHCHVCGGHFVGFYENHIVHERCSEYPPELVKKIHEKRDQEWEKIYGNSVKAFWEGSK